MANFDFDLRELIFLERANLEKSPFNLTQENFQAKMAARSQLCHVLSAEVIKFCEGLGLKNREEILKNLWQLWLPLAVELRNKKEKLKRTFVQGILGGQGTGKSTLTAILKLILERFGYSVATLSIDDLYLTYERRKRLQQQDSRLIWRGPPGTHDVRLGLEVIDGCIKNSGSILLPRFDKSLFQGAGDRTASEAIDKVDILLFEGWFVGARPLTDENVFNDPPAPIVTSEDKQFAIDNNRRLKVYVSLWEKLDSLVVLNPVDYRLSKQWRREAEQKMKAEGKTGMSDAEIDRFVEYFWKSLHPELFITPLIDNLNSTDLVVDIERDRSIKFVRKAI